MSIRTRLSRLERNAGIDDSELVWIVPRYDGETREQALAAYPGLDQRTNYAVMGFPQPGPRPAVPDHEWPKDHMSISFEELDALIAYTQGEMERLRAEGATA